MLENPLSRLTWGIEPPSRRRRLVAVTSALLPLAVCLGLWPFSYAMAYARLSEVPVPVYLLPLHLLPRRFLAEFSGPPDALPIFYLFTMSVNLTFFAVLVPIIQACLGGGSNSLRSNWPEYRLAGLSGSKILWGTAPPAMIGILGLAVLLLGLHLLFTIAFLCGLNTGGTPWISVVVFVAALVSLVGGVLLDWTLRVLTSDRPLRILAVLAFVLASPVLLTSAKEMLSTSLGNWPLAQVGEVPLTPIRIWIVWRVYRRAVRRVTVSTEP